MGQEKRSDLAHSLPFNEMMADELKVKPPEKVKKVQKRKG
jgi:hypothetical protein